MVLCFLRLGWIASHRLWSWSGCGDTAELAVPCVSLPGHWQTLVELLALCFRLLIKQKENFVVLVFSILCLHPCFLRVHVDVRREGCG